MIKHKLILFSITIFYVLNVNIIAQHISKIQNVPENALLYALPKTSIVIEINYLRTSCFKGIFGDYSKEFLGYEPEIKENSVKYKLLNANIKSLLITDEDQFYIFAPTKGDIKIDKINNLSERGLIITTFEYPDICLSSSVLNPADKLHENYIPFESLYKDRIDTVYKREFRDSTWMDVPYYKRTYLLKEERDYAKEAASLLIWLNDNIIKSAGRLNPEDEYDPDVSEALYMETNQLIKKYQKLFEGKCYSDTFSFKTIITPEPGKTSYSIATFSEGSGINKDNKGNEIILNIVPQIQLDSMAVLSKKIENQSDRLFYRIPVNSLIIINYDDNQLYKALIPIQQLGNIFSLPSKAVVDK